MKRGVFTLVVAGLISAPLLAAPTAFVDRSGAYWNAGLGGGQFNVTPSAELMAISGETGSFLTFCLEMNEPLVPPDTFLADVQPDAFLGGYYSGAPGPNGGDPLDTRTAYLYRQFRDGVITINSDIEAGIFQQAVYVIEEELLPSQVGAPALDLVNEATLNADGSLYGIQVLHLWKVNPQSPLKPILVQDLLISGGAVRVPSPGALLLGSLGLGLVRCFRGRRISRA